MADTGFTPAQVIEAALKNQSEYTPAEVSHAVEQLQAEAPAEPREGGPNDFLIAGS